MFCDEESTRYGQCASTPLPPNKACKGFFASSVNACIEHHSYCPGSNAKSTSHFSEDDEVVCDCWWGFHESKEYSRLSPEEEICVALWWNVPYAGLALWIWIFIGTVGAATILITVAVVVYYRRKKGNNSVYVPIDYLDELDNKIE